MNIENFSGDAQSFERGSNLYAQVSTELKGGFEEVKQNYSTATSFLPEVSLQDAGANFISSPGRLGGDERRKAAEQATKQQEAPGRKEAPAQRKADEELPQRERPRGSLNEAPAQKGNEGPTRREDPAQKEQKGKEEPTRKEQQQGSKGSEQQNKNPKDCVDYGARGTDVMKKPTSWKPDTELKSKQAQDWNNHAKELRNKPLKTDKDGNYDVQHGDSLWGIAERSVKDRTGKAASPSDTYKEMQRIVGMNADKLGSQSNWQMIKPGMKLRVKGDGPCEVPGKASGESGNGKAIGGDQNGTPKKGEQQNGNQRGTEQQNRGQQKTEQRDSPQEKKGDGTQQQTERTITGDKGQKITVDAQERVSKIDYPNGLHVKFEYAGNSKDYSRVVVQGNGQDVVLVKSGAEYKVIDHGKETKDTIQKIEINKDGSAVLTGTRDFGGAKVQGQKIVSADGTTRDRMI